MSFVIESKQKSRGDQGHGRGLSSKDLRKKEPGGSDWKLFHFKKEKSVPTISYWKGWRRRGRSQEPGLKIKLCHSGHKMELSDIGSGCVLTWLLQDRESLVQRLCPWGNTAFRYNPVARVL